MAAFPADLADAPAHRLQRLFASGEASPVDACRAVLARIERFDPEYRAFVRVDAEGALSAARASEARDGLPIGIQFVGPMFRDDLVLRAAAAYEAIRPIPRPPVTRAASRRAE